MTLSSSSSWTLLSRIRLGDSSALARLVDRYLPRLRSWAHRRLPGWVRTFADTTDLVHDAIAQSLRRLPHLERRSQNALQAYFRTAIANCIRDQHRRVGREGVAQPLLDVHQGNGPSPLDRVIANETRDRYRRALARLSAADQSLVIGHVHLHYTHIQLGWMTGRNANAARMALQRAIERLAAHMRDA